jgi:serine/threonine protein kinase
MKVIGKGGFSRVIQVRRILDGKIFAMKIMSKEFLLKEDKLEQILTEK